MQRIRIFAALLLCAPLLFAQSNPAPDAPQPQAGTHASNGTVGGIFPVRYVVQPDEKPAPLATREKFIVATQNSFDAPAFLVPAFVGGVNLAQGRYHEFDDGLGALGKYYGVAFLDQTVATYMASAVFPSIFHQDPRYYRLGKANGTPVHRTLYAIEQEIFTHGDSGNREFNLSELGGNAVAAGFANIYYPDRTRTVNDTLSRFAVQIGTDAFFNILKEFSPALNRHTPHHHHR